MKKVLLSLVLVGALLFALNLTANAVDPVTPTVSSIEPAIAYNDIDTVVRITGASFTVDASITPTVVPTVTLGGTPLTGVTWVDTETLTATVPWGMDPRTYGLTVTDPGGGSSTLPSAFTVAAGIGQWNPGELNGASVTELLMKPGHGLNTNTLYALAYDVGLFRSQDAGASWQFTSADVIGNADFVLDPNAGHESWLYSFMSSGLFVSKNDGDSWTQLTFDPMDKLGSPPQHEVFVSPHNASSTSTDTLFVATYGDQTDVSYRGLKKSVDGGRSWTPIHSMDGTAVQNVAFDPTPGSQKIVLATADARVFTSDDDGEKWVLAPSQPPIASLGFRGYLTYNPYYAEKPGEVWLSSTETTGGVFKCTFSDPDPVWTRAEPTYYTSGYKVTFVGPDDVYMWNAHSTDGGATWDNFGPPESWGPGDYVFDPDDTRTIFFTDSMFGVRKSTTGGITGPSGETSWTVSNSGLTGMRCVTMAVSKTDPLRVYAAFNGWGGVFVSDDGTTHWSYVPIVDSGQVFSVIIDPFEPGVAYAAGQALYTSTDDGATWHASPGSPAEGMDVLAADPHRPGHLLGASRVSASSAHDNDTADLHSSVDHGATWQPVVVAAGSLGPINGITFDPETTDTIYLATDGTGQWKTVNGGASWKRIDDGSKRMASSWGIYIATHPTKTLFVTGLDGGSPRASEDGGDTWHDVPDGNGATSGRFCMFADEDSTRLYSATWDGLYFTPDMGKTWTRAAGVLGSLQVTTLASADADGHTLLYAASTGGKKTGVVIASAKVDESAAAARVAPEATAPSSLVGAGIYRRAQISTTTTFTSSASRDGWISESSEHSSKGKSTSSSSATFRLGDNASKRQYRGVLSFGTSGIPDSAVITKVTLRFRKQGVSGGGDPFTKFQGLMLDVKKGFFGTKTSLQASDFQAAASKSYGVGKPGAVGGWYSIGLTGAKAYINKTSSHSGLTQLRLRFKLDDNNNRTANYLRLYSGNASAASRPQLVVTYYLP